jgi:hypothetical protein
MTGVNEARACPPLMQHRTSAIADLSLRSGKPARPPRVCAVMGGQSFSRSAMAPRSHCNHLPIS